MAYLTDQQLIDGFLPGDVVRDSDSDDRGVALAAASAEADGYLRRAGYVLPLATAGDDLKGAVGRIAAYRVMTKLGRLPEPAAQSVYYLDYKAAIAWLQGVAAGTITPIVVDAEAETSVAAAPLIESEAKRGW